MKKERQRLKPTPEQNKAFEEKIIDFFYILVFIVLMITMGSIILYLLYEGSRIMGRFLGM